ncbi:MAG TPA: hypothetical protein VL240_14395 [Candidatus Binatia bacterium]|nr:hypothetical protein [Candidatus Binatia bacterium]
MRKVLVLSLLVALFAICLQAQESSKSVTIQGCLQYTMHHYVLTDSSGTQHRLTGYATKLKPHVGHEVEITGTEGTHTESTTQQGAASTAKQVPDIKVSGMKHIADTCQAASH